MKKEKHDILDEFVNEIIEENAFGITEEEIQEQEIIEDGDKNENTD